MRQYLKRRIDRMLYSIFDRYQSDLIALQHLAALAPGYIPWTATSIKPADLVTLLNDIVLNQRQTIVECGSGVSTLHIASLLRRTGGHLYSIEDDATWAALMRKQITELKLSEFVTLIHAPRIPCSEAYHTMTREWFDERVLDSALGDRQFDQLIVDGPQGFNEAQTYIRYPALPYFKQRMKPQHSIALDDTDKPAGQLILQQWETLYEMQFHRPLNGRRVALYRTDGAFAVYTNPRRVRL
jgi:hypothetical protein